MLAAALEYVAAFGWPVFPTDGKKEPLTKHGFRDASLDEAQIRAWWQAHPDAGVAVATGEPSGLFVVDVDSQKGGAATWKALIAEYGKLPPTAVTLTGGGGAHMLFEHPGDVPCSTGRLGAHVDVRADGGYAILPPSVHANGRPYKWMVSPEAGIAQPPGWLVELARGRRNGNKPSAVAPVGDVIAEGERNATLASLAGTMRKRGMGAPEILAALTVTNEQRCRPPLTADELGRIAASVARYEPEQKQPEPLPFEPVSVNWPLVHAQGVPRLEYLLPPDLPARKRIWGVGAAESGKSIWAAHRSSVLTRAGITVVYVSQENGEEEELRRFLRLRPDYSKLRLYVDEGFNLADPAHARVLIAAAEGAGLVVLDTLSAVWSGDEDSNAAIGALDRDVLKPLVLETGASVLVLDHTGNPQAFVKRRGVSAPRGASAKGQKADFLLEFRAADACEFTIDQGKARGTVKQPRRGFRVVDTDDDGLDLVEVETSADQKAAVLANQLVDIIREAAPLATNKLRQAAQAQHQAGVVLQSAAMALLEAEDPPRVIVGWEMLESQRAKVWRPASDAPAAQMALEES